MFPMPQWHITNREIIQLPLFWANIIYTSRLLNQQLKKVLGDAPQTYPIEAVAVNFGTWETAGAIDRRLIDCHAHVHLLLTLEFINSCDDKFFRALKGRVMSPPNYFRQNAQSLHNNRLQNHEFNSREMNEFSKRLTIVEEKQNNMYKELQGVKSDVQGVKSDVQGVKSDVQDVKTKIDSLDTKLNTLFKLITDHFQGRTPIQESIN